MLKHMLKPRMVLHTYNPQYFRHWGRRFSHSRPASPSNSGRVCCKDNTGPSMLTLWWDTCGAIWALWLSPRHHSPTTQLSMQLGRHGLKKNTTEFSQKYPDLDKYPRFSKVGINKEKEKNHSFNYSGAPSCGGEISNQQFFKAMKIREKTVSCLFF